MFHGQDSNDNEDEMVYIVVKDESNDEEDKMTLISHIRKMIHGLLSVDVHII